MSETRFIDELVRLRTAMARVEQLSDEFAHEVKYSDGSDASKARMNSLCSEMRGLAEGVIRG